MIMNKTFLSFPILLLPLLVVAGCQKKTESTTTTTTTSSTPVVATAAAATAPVVATASAIATVSASASGSAAPKMAASATPNPKGCIVLDTENMGADGPPVTLEGTVIIDATFEHPTRGPVRPYILKLSAPKCVLNGGDELKSVTEIHIAPSEGLEVKPFVGKKVRLVDGAPFHSHTAWHARDVVVMTKKLVAI
jgi:hypothetical protein